jgi:tetratricopeptide (TPR) repeat protein
MSKEISQSAPRKKIISKVILQFVLVSAVFAIVLVGTYPVMLEAQREEELNHYPDKLLLEENIARRRYALVENHPENIDEFIAAGDELASVLLRQQNFDATTDIYQKQMTTTWPLATNSYNPRYVAANLKLASVFRDRGDMKTALVCYKSAMDLDRKYLPATDPKIARDLNNIGLMHYLNGLSLEKDQDRKPEFQLAIDNLNQALVIINQHPESQGLKATAMWNLYLAERDIGDKSAALDFRKQAQAIDETMHRVCREP